MIDTAQNIMGLENVRTCADEVAIQERIHLEHSFYFPSLPYIFTECYRSAIAYYCYQGPDCTVSTLYPGPLD